MYKGKYQAPRRKPTVRRKPAVILLSLLLVVVVAVGGTVAYLLTSTDPVTNVFTPSSAGIDIEEKYDGKEKTEITVENTGDFPVFVRVQLVSYRVDENGSPIGGDSSVPEFYLSSDWTKIGDYYYYNYPVDVNDTTKNLIANGSSIVLQKYEDADGGVQEIDVLAQCIQSVPAEAVQEAWGVTINNGSVTIYQGGAGA